MAAATDYFTATYKAIMSLCTNRTELMALIAKGNVIDFSGPRPFPQKLPNQRPPDFPALYLYQGQGTDNLVPLDTFSEQSTFGPASEWQESVTQSYRFLILGQDRRVQPTNQILSEFLTAVRKGSQANPKFGITSATQPGQGVIVTAKATWTHSETDRLPECAGTVRSVVDGQIAVQFLFEGASELIT